MLCCRLWLSGSVAKDTGAWLRMRSARSLCAQLLGTLSAVLARAELLPASSLVRQACVLLIQSGGEEPACLTMSKQRSVVGDNHPESRMSTSMMAASGELELHHCCQALVLSAECCVISLTCWQAQQQNEHEIA